jgi:uncharacterized membrane protein YhhN
MIVLAIMGYALLAIIEFIPLYKKKIMRDFWADTIIGTFSFMIAVLLCLNVKIPSPVKPIEKLIISIFGK